jgi:hypothetical protein
MRIATGEEADEVVDDGKGVWCKEASRYGVSSQK